MAFDLTKFDRISNNVNPSVNNQYTYTHATDTLAQIAASGYFNLQKDVYKAGDKIVVKAADRNGVLTVTSAAHVSPVTTKEEGAYGLIKFCGKGNNAGGSATVALTVTGVAATDVVFAAVEASTNAAYVIKVVPTANTITVTLSADPGAATVISYVVLNPMV